MESVSQSVNRSVSRSVSLSVTSVDEGFTEFTLLKTGFHLIEMIEKRHKNSDMMIYHIVRWGHCFIYDVLTSVIRPDSLVVSFEYVIKNMCLVWCFNPPTK